MPTAKITEPATAASEGVAPVCASTRGVGVGDGVPARLTTCETGVRGAVGLTDGPGDDGVAGMTGGGLTDAGGVLDGGGATDAGGVLDGGGATDAGGVLDGGGATDAG
ncbi:MAG: hypothetical protein QOH56_4022, partial [Pseudonocardiales bacterium]|nr:hypothetical protein [Pseudonocardiales bacterium]